MVYLLKVIKPATRRKIATGILLKEERNKELKIFKL